MKDRTKTDIVIAATGLIAVVAAFMVFGWIGGLMTLLIFLPAFTYHVLDALYRSSLLKDEGGE